MGLTSSMFSPRRLVLGSALGLAGAGAAGALTWAGARIAVRGRRTARLRRKVVVVTGGSRGLGLAIARELIDLGCKVAICGRDESTLERARVELSARAVDAQNGSEVLALPCDATDPEDVEGFFDAVLARFGRFDVLVTVASTIQVGPLEAMSRRDFEDALQSIFWSAVYPSLAAIPIMKAQREGQIAHVCSIGGIIAIPHLVPYSAAKFGSVGFSEGLRAELAKDRIAVTTIIPGLMRTGSHLHAHFKGRVDAEYGWFGLSATSPLTAMDAGRAARSIVRAIANRDEVIVLGLAAKMVERVHAIAPMLARRALGLAGRAMPHTHDGSAGEPTEGVTVERESHRASVRAIAALGRREAERFHQR